MLQYRTDLAMEAPELLCARSRAQTLSGVDSRTVFRRGCSVTSVRIDTEGAARQLGKPRGRYVTLDLSPLPLNDADYFHDIYLMFGLNEVGTDVNSFVQSYKTLIEYVREHQTKANIYVISVTPVTQKVDADPNEVQSMDRINAFNSALKQLCADEKCWYLDIYSMLVDEYGYLSSDYAFAGDGKHFEKSGYVAWANYMKTHYVDEGLLTE